MARVEKFPMTAEQRETVVAELAFDLLTKFREQMTPQEIQECVEVADGRAATIGRLTMISSIHAKYFNSEDKKTCTPLASTKSPA